MKVFYCIFLLCLSNVFMTFAWVRPSANPALSGHQQIILAGYHRAELGPGPFRVRLSGAANRVGSQETGGPFSLFELKMIQEVVSLTVFTLITVFLFKTDKLAWNHVVGFLFLLVAVFFIFKKW